MTLQAPPEALNPQGWGLGFSLAAVQLSSIAPLAESEDTSATSNVIVEPRSLELLRYDPLHGLATVAADPPPTPEETGEAGEQPPRSDLAPPAAEDTHQVAWIDAEEWWRSPGSAMAGDQLGLLLDCDAGVLTAYRNGEELGVVFSGLPNGREYCWAVSLGPGMHVHVASASGVASLELLTTRQSLEAAVSKPPPRPTLLERADHSGSSGAVGGLKSGTGSATILERVAAAVMSTISVSLSHSPKHLFFFATLCLF